MFETDSKTVWEKDVRELAVDIRDTCTSDRNLVRTLEAMIMHVDSDSTKGINFSERLLPLQKVITSESYYLNNKSLQPDEIVKVKSLIKPLIDLYKISSYELRYQKKNETPVTLPERLPNSKNFTMKDYEPIELKDRL